MQSNLLPSQIEQAKAIAKYDKSVASRYLRSINRYNSGCCVYCNSSDVVSLTTSKNSKTESDTCKYQCQKCKRKF